MNKIDLEITETVRCWVKHSLGPQKKPVENKVTGQWNDRNSETGKSEKMFWICSTE